MALECSFTSFLSKQDPLEAFDSSVVPRQCQGWRTAGPALDCLGRAAELHRRRPFSAKPRDVRVCERSPLPGR
jgi:hypothetical protein